MKINHPVSPFRFTNYLQTEFGLILGKQLQIDTPTTPNGPTIENVKTGNCKNIVVRYIARVVSTHLRDIVEKIKDDEKQRPSLKHLTDNKTRGISESIVSLVTIHGGVYRRLLACSIRLSCRYCRQILFQRFYKNNTVSRKNCSTLRMGL